MSELDRYDYELPRELIAQEPLRRRVDARLLVLERDRGRLQHLHVRDLPQLLAPGDALVMNDTRVIPARLVGYRTATGGRWTGLLLGAEAQGIWKVMCKTRGRLRPGETVTLEDGQSQKAFRLEMLADLGNGCWAVRPERRDPWLELLEWVGRVPLPPYIRGGEMEPSDRERYQTTFAEHPGSVAAPTAGLHFTRPLLDAIAKEGIDLVRVTLHVGVGTFRPMTASTLDEHAMHAEWGRIDADAVERLRACRARGGRIIAVGTTSVRVLETAAAEGRLRAWCGETDLFIRPPFQFHATDALLTNFHLPKSTLLVLVRTFGGEQAVQRAYAAAVEQRYRFYSYGDAMLIL